jgi:SARP family transcriptional regulator, regulator of embCAB operon
MLKYQVLGPLRITHGGTSIAIGPLRLERVMATLILRANQVVPVPQLIAEVWGEEPPARAKEAVHVYVSQLRKKLSAKDGFSPIVTRHPGYFLVADDESIDCRIFQRLAAQGRSHLKAGRPEDALSSFDKALALWSATSLSDIYDGPATSGDVNALDEVRLECLELQIEAGLLLNRHRSLIGPLYALIAEYPLYEVFYAQLIRSLCLSQRRGDALSVYRMAWEVLDRELGLEPGEKLQEVHRSVLGMNNRRLGVA